MILINVCAIYQINVNDILHSDSLPAFTLWIKRHYQVEDKSIPNRPSFFAQSTSTENKPAFVVNELQDTNIKI